MTLKEKAKNLLELRAKINEAEEKLKPLKVERDEMQANIIASMIRVGFDSVKVAGMATISKAIRKTLVIQDEDALVADLKERKLTDMVKERVNVGLWRPFATQAVKDNLTLGGTELKETSFISIRKVVDKKNDKN